VRMSSSLVRSSHCYRAHCACQFQLSVRALWVCCAAVLIAAVSVTSRPVVAGVLPVAVSAATSASDLAPLLVVSQPSGAEILVDNRELGRTPGTVDVTRESTLVLRKDGFLDPCVSAERRGSTFSCGEHIRTCSACGRHPGHVDRFSRFPARWKRRAGRRRASGRRASGLGL
jgi:PEGA domain